MPITQAYSYNVHGLVVKQSVKKWSVKGCVARSMYNIQVSLYELNINNNRSQKWVNKTCYSQQTTLPCTTNSVCKETYK